MTHLPGDYVGFKYFAMHTGAVRCALCGHKYCPHAVCRRPTGHQSLTASFLPKVRVLAGPFTNPLPHQFKFSSQRQ